MPVLVWILLALASLFVVGFVGYLEYRQHGYKWYMKFKLDFFVLVAGTLLYGFGVFKILKFMGLIDFIDAHVVLETAVFAANLTILVLVWKRGARFAEESNLEEKMDNSWMSKVR